MRLTLDPSCVQMPEFLHESGAFGRTAEPAVASCVQMVKTGFK